MTAEAMCPICQRPVLQGQRPPEFPFCSRRCQQVDLCRWIDGRYAVVDDLAQRPDVLLNAEDLPAEFDDSPG